MRWLPIVIALVLAIDGSLMAGAPRACTGQLKSLAERLRRNLDHYREAQRRVDAMNPIGSEHDSLILAMGSAERVLAGSARDGVVVDLLHHGQSGLVTPGRTETISLEAAQRNLPKTEFTLSLTEPTEFETAWTMAERALRSPQWPIDNFIGLKAVDALVERLATQGPAIQGIGFQATLWVPESFSGEDNSARVPFVEIPADRSPHLKINYQGVGQVMELARNKGLRTVDIRLFSRERRSSDEAASGETRYHPAYKTFHPPTGFDMTKSYSELIPILEGWGAFHGKLIGNLDVYVRYADPQPRWRSNYAVLTERYKHLERLLALRKNVEDDATFFKRQIDASIEEIRQNLGVMGYRLEGEFSPEALLLELENFLKQFETVAP